MSDTNRKSIMDFVARSQQQFAERRKQQQQRQQDGSDPSAMSAFVTPRSAEVSSAAGSTATTMATDRKADAEHNAALLKSWSSRVEDFVNDAALTRMELPNLLSGGDRRELHGLASKYNLSHSSVGSGTQRRLVLTKDALFYRGNNAGITTGIAAVDISSSSNNNNNNNNNNRSSLMSSSSVADSFAAATGVSAAVAGTGQRNMSRRERQEMRSKTSEKELYADAAAFKGFRRFQDATNPLARAVQVDDGTDFEVPRGFQQQQTDVLRFGETSNNNENNNNSASSSFVASAAAAASGIREPRRRHREEENNPQKQQQLHQQNDGDDDDAGDHHVAAAAPIADGEFMTATQVEEAARVNELADGDVKWITAFAERCCAADDPDGSQGGTERIVFCIDFSDFTSACGPLSRAKAQSKKKKKIVVVDVSESDQQQRENGDDESSNNEDAFGQKVNALIAASGHESGMCLCLPGMPLFGEPLRVGLGFEVEDATVPAALMDACKKLGASANIF